MPNLAPLLNCVLARSAKALGSTVSRSNNRLILAALLAAPIVLGTTSVVHAGKCHVKFLIRNNTAYEVRVRAINALGNGGGWTENISNVKLQPGETHLTNRRRLNRLDEGRSGTFSVRHDFFAGGSWRRNRTGPTQTKTCRPNLETIELNVWVNYR